MSEWVSWRFSAMDFTQLISEDALDGYNVPCNNQGNAGQSANQAIINAGTTSKPCHLIIHSLTH